MDIRNPTVFKSEMGMALFLLELWLSEVYTTKTDFSLDALFPLTVQSTS